MPFVLSMAEIETGHVHSCLRHIHKGFVPRTGGADSADNLYLGHSPKPPSPPKFPTGDFPIPGTILPYLEHFSRKNLLDDRGYGSPRIDPDILEKHGH
ncbi:hypothetical protein SDC9_43003 [bioreactor metagenome]|uniref:Uncharacterized protein n=1 Tax=bioreactor metagenome TaxID=1076179 RepID=A0A644VZE6_9ZZZZ